MVDPLLVLIENTLTIVAMILVVWIELTPCWVYSVITQTYIRTIKIIFISLYQEQIFRLKKNVIVNGNLDIYGTSLSINIVLKQKQIMSCSPNIRYTYE